MAMQHALEFYDRTFFKNNAEVVYRSGIFSVS